MVSRFRVSSLLATKLEELGVSASLVLRHAGLPLQLFSQERILVSTEEFFALYRAIGEVSRDPVIGLKLGSEQRIERYNPIAIAALYTRSFGDALLRMARYKQLTCPEEIRVTQRGDHCRVEFQWLLARESEPATLIDTCFAWILLVGRRGTGGPVTPLRVELRREPVHRDILEAHFGCTVKFRADRNALIFRKSDLDRPFVTHNAELLAMLAPQLEAELNDRRARQTVRDQVKGTLKRILAGQRPSIQEVARELSLSARTLQRRLSEAGITFQQILEEARRELAYHYLLQSSLELNETAYLLGYENANSFHRAFHHWEGTSPGQWRDDRRRASVAVTSGPASGRERNAVFSATTDH
jgi:AraC-like DNA-binding protein